MLNNIYIHIALAVLISMFIAAFQYLYKSKNKSNTKLILFVLRFLAIFLLLLLLINPKIKKNKLEVIKPSFVVLTDNSKSIDNLKQSNRIISFVDEIKKDSELNDKFKIDYYTFSDDISVGDSLSFDKTSTNIYKSIRSIDKIYKSAIAPIILITDGNQTFGNNYSNIKLNQDIYPLVVGDTTIYQDIFISKLNVNKYAYLKNKFPVELFINYKGIKPITSKLTITNGKSTVYSNNIILDGNNNSKKIDLFLKANSVGFHNYKVRLSAIDNEKNKLNNSKQFSIEVLNEQSKIVIVSDILHPDVAMFKRAIESNKQRKVIIIKSDKFKDLKDYNLLILYQPTVKFKSLFEEIKKTKRNFLIVTGTHTDWNFLSNSQNYFKKKSINSTEDYLAVYNSAYNTFLTKDLGFENFQPLTDYFGKISFSVPYQSVLFQQIGNINSSDPLLATFNQDDIKGAVLFGENSWRWRMSSKIEANSFEPYDEFINKIIQYLASNKKDSFLDVINKPFYYQNETVNINAKYYDANYVFDANAKLWITISNKQTKKQIKYPFALLNNDYEVNISDLNKGNYSFKVSNEANDTQAYGNFTILDYSIEQQFISANKNNLEELASNTNGSITYPNEFDNLIKKIVNNSEYKSIQKSKEIVKPLIDWKWILGIIVLLLSTEWFIRKFKGYI